MLAFKCPLENYSKQMEFMSPMRPPNGEVNRLKVRETKGVFPLLQHKMKPRKNNNRQWLIKNIKLSVSVGHI